MKKHSFFVQLFLFLVLFSFVQAEAKDEWIKVRSKNFYLIGNAADKDIRRVATKLEQFRVVFSNLFPKMKFTSAIPTTVIVFKSDRAFKPYKPVNAAGKATDWVAGYFQPGEDINYITITTEGEREETFRTIFHEYTHYLVDNTMGRSSVPPWFNEGLAEYYERFLIEGDQKVTLGGLNSNHLDLLRTNQLIPLEQFFNIDYPSLHQQGNHGASIFYAESWALMHYLIQSNQGVRVGQMGMFLDLLLKGVKNRDAFQQAFKMDYAAMDAELRKYVGQNRFNISVATFQQKLLFEADMQTSLMTDAEAKANLGDLLSHSRRLDDAETHLLEALAMDANSVMANSSMGFVKMKQRKFAEAMKYLEKAAAADQKNFMVYYRYAYTLSREVMDSGSRITSGFSDETAQKMQDALARSIALNPGFPESYGLLAMISLVRNEKIDEGIANLNKAIALSPGNPSYQMNLASLYMTKREFEKAQPIIENIIRTADEPGIRSHAQNMLNSLNYIREQIARAKSEGRQVRMGERVIVSGEGKPPTEAEMAKMQAEAEHEAIVSALREPKDGEIRIFGYLSKIECSSGNIFYTIRADGQLIKLQSKDFMGLNVMAYGPSTETEIGCGSVKKEFYAILTYVPKENPKTKTKGELVSIEIVPDKFKL